MQRLLVVACLIGLVGRGRADPFADRHVLAIDYGLGSPIGYVGVTYTQPVIDWVRVELGAGLGFTGTQLSGMVGYGWRRREQLASKLFPSWGTTKVTMGSAIGLAASIPRNQEDGVTDWWLNADLVTVSATLGNFAFRFAVGGTMEVKGDATFCPYFYDDGCSASELKDLLGVPLPQVRFGIGVAW